MGTTNTLTAERVRNFWVINLDDVKEFALMVIDCERMAESEAKLIEEETGGQYEFYSSRKELNEAITYYRNKFKGLNAIIATR